MKLARREFLRGAGVTLALPLLDWSSRGYAQSVPTVPKRFIVFMNGEGTLNNSLCDLWTPPALANNALDLSQVQLLDFLVPHQNKMVVMRGIDNAVHELYQPGNGHIGPGHSILTACLPQTAVDAAGNYIPRASQALMQISTKMMGPSIDHYIASKLGGPDSMHLSVNEPEGGEYHSFSKVTKDPDGANTYVEMIPDPVNVFNTYIATQTHAAPTRLQRFAAKRTRVLDAVKDSFNALYSKVGHDDRLRLEQHAQRISDLEATLTNVPPMSCAVTTQNLPAGFPAQGPYWGSMTGPIENVLSTAQIDNLVQLITCGGRNVMTLTHDNYDGPPMTFLANDPDVPAADVSDFPITGDNWHSHVHRADGSPANSPILIYGFRFYGKQFKHLLDQLDAIVEPNGKTVLDNSLVLWTSEFGDGGSHDTNNVPMILAGGLQGALKTGRFLDYKVTSSQPTRYTPGDVYTSILKLFGYDETFGYTGQSGLNNGGLPNLIL